MVAEAGLVVGGRIGQVIKFRVRKLPDYAVVVGDIEDGGDVDTDNPDDIPNAFAGKEKEYFRGNNSELLLGKNKVYDNAEEFLETIKKELI